MRGDRLSRLEQTLTDLQKNLSSIQSSLTQSTTPTQTSDVLSMMTLMKEMFEAERRETREMVLDILQGRPQQTSPKAIEEIVKETMTNYDEGSDGLPPFLVAVAQREAEETLHQTLTRERQELQQRLVDLEREQMSLLNSEESSPLPFEGVEYSTTNGNENPI